MSAKTHIGDACAHIAGKAGGKSRYVRVGSAFSDDQNRVSIKIDTLPISVEPWSGWINVFPKRDNTPKARDGGPPFEGDDDIPF